MRNFVVAAVLWSTVSPAFADDGPPGVAPRTNVEPVLPPRIVETPSTASRTPAIIATAATGALLVAAAAAYHHHTTLQDRTDRLIALDTASGHYNGASTSQEAVASYNTSLEWRSVMLAFAGTAVVSGGLAAYLWTTTEPTKVIIHPTIGGAEVSYSGHF